MFELLTYAMYIAEAIIGVIVIGAVALTSLEKIREILE